ncbi:hypothetical protein [Chryseobacterium sp.]|uniref:hypothetical protein n=1 Tax=Chryseobacterium sp. TaxID=1871047 RepID=UPI0035B2CFB0
MNSKKILNSLFIFTGTIIFAQVGVNNINPKATLDVTAKTTDGSKPEGIIAPRLTGDQIQAADGQYGIDQKGTLIFAISSVTSTTPKTVHITGPGYYYFDGNVWQKFIESTSTNWYIAGTTNDAAGSKTSAIARTGQVVIGNNVSPDASAILDMSLVSGKGILVPQVSLVSGTDQVTILNPKTGLLVYNTGSAGLQYQGYVYWNGIQWRTFDNSSTSVGTLSGLNCNSASLTPSTYTAGTLYNGTLTVPYVGGDGGSYTAQTLGPVNGLTASISAGNFATGSGTLNYNIVGMPTVSSPNVTTFNLNIGGQSCSATVGNSVVIKNLEFAKNTTSPINSNTPTNSVTTLGNISIRMNATNANANGNLFDLRLNGFSDHITVWREVAGGGGTNYDNWSRYNSVVSNTWQTLNSGVTISNNDSLRFLISLLNKREIYRVNIVMNSDIALTPSTLSGVTIFIEKLD